MNENIEQRILITEIIGNIAAMQKKIQAEGEDEEKNWMIKNASEPAVIEFLKEATVQMLHVLDAIGELEPVNGITISKRFGIPRGSVSKNTRRLVELGFIKTETLPDNKKEVLFHLTSSGQQVFELHQQLHAHIDNNIRSYLGQYDLEQIRFLAMLMKDTLATSWVQAEADDDKNQEKSQMSSNSLSGDLEETNEILTMLRKLDSKKLSRAKELIRLAFFED
ncbi:winged helix DNA-binding protein [Paenibacillus gallinarum]|uniref:MarR family transcriptional regulator n=1 Tax=Paenibacillus gallinarum TaxID=2762232 RepID=A0ABR8T7J9_9BACL|nr:MarR family transcriptional regulator [Paenibacillus gallinarum]MBD7971324.1 MarR family transcriptional regulator [Paenibacillus gallinarum]